VVWSNQDVLETPGEVDRLQRLLDRSAAAAGAHLRDILTGDHRLSAAEACERLRCPREGPAAVVRNRTVQPPSRGNGKR
jgi:hypothetical protein